MTRHAEGCAALSGGCPCSPWVPPELEPAVGGGFHHISTPQSCTEKGPGAGLWLFPPLLGLAWAGLPGQQMCLVHSQGSHSPTRRGSLILQLFICGAGTTVSSWLSAQGKLPDQHRLWQPGGRPWTLPAHLHTQPASLPQETQRLHVLCSGCCHPGPYQPQGDTGSAWLLPAMTGSHLSAGVGTTGFSSLAPGAWSQELWPLAQERALLAGP